MDKLNCRIAIEQPAAGQDANGQPSTSWTLFGMDWANIKTLSGMETIRANAQTPASVASIRIRTRAGITSAMRIRTADTIYCIKAVPPVGSNAQYMDLVCEAIDAGS
jgi:SPP1 family predicted phage head-tail adaptor